MSLSKFLNPKNDVAFKRIFGSEKNKDILVHFINDIQEFKGDQIIEDVEFLSPIQDPDIISKKQSIVDVLCKDKAGRKIIVEMQVAPQKGFEKRAQYYAAKAYSGQLNRGKNNRGDYTDLKEIIFIAISDYIIFKDKEEYISHHVVLDKSTYEHDLQDFSFTFIELPKFGITEISKLSNILEKWCYFFQNAHETTESELKSIIGSDLVLERAYEALNQFNWTEEELFTYDAEIKRIMDNRAAELYVLDMVESAKNKALETGLEQGLEKGREEGVEKAKIAMVTEMIKANSDITFIAKITGMSTIQIKRIADKLKRS